MTSSPVHTLVINPTRREYGYLKRQLEEVTTEINIQSTQFDSDEVTPLLKLQRTRLRRRLMSILMQLDGLGQLELKENQQ